MNCLSSCKSRIYNVRVIVIGNYNEVFNFIRDNKFINDLSGIHHYNINPPVVTKSRARASRVRVGMQSPEKPFGLAFPETK